MIIHVVQRGETVRSIASHYGVNETRLSEDNSIPSSGALAIGQTLVIRIPRLSHVIQSGDTLTSLSVKYNTTVRKLWRNNWPLGGNSTLTPGETLIISYWDEPTDSIVSNGYAYPFIPSDLLNTQLPFLSYLTPFTYGITATGHLLPLNDDALMSAARQRGTFPVMHLSTLTESDNFDTARAELILTNNTLQTQLIGEIIQVALRKGYAGVDTDFEYLPAYLSNAYASFLNRLRRLLSAHGKFLWAALAPKTSAQQRGLLYEGHNYSAVGMAVHGVLLMTYEWGYAYGPPMAVAPLPNVRSVLDYAITEIPPQKIFLGVPNYGYDWQLPFVQGKSHAQSISNQQAIDLALTYNAVIQYDEVVQSPFFHYTAEDNTQHEVWFEDARSLSAKLHLVSEYGFQGVGFWNIMRPFSQTWLVLNSLYNIL